MIIGLKGPWILIDLDSSVVDHLTSDVGDHLTSDVEVPGSNSQSSRTFSFVFLSIFVYFNVYMYIHSSYPYYRFFRILVQILTIFKIHTWTCNIYNTMYLLTCSIHVHPDSISFYKDFEWSNYIMKRFFEILINTCKAPIGGEMF